MAILVSEDKKELLVNCTCGCDEGIHIKIEEDEEFYAVLTYTNGKFYSEQEGAFATLGRKMKKIWAIIRNKDYTYSEVVMKKEEFHQFCNYILSQSPKV